MSRSVDFKVRRRRIGTLVGRAALVVFTLAALVFGSAMTHLTSDKQALARQFLAAPQCVGKSTPTTDCFSWQTETISDVSWSKATVDINLDGGTLEVYYFRVPTWVKGLTQGESVPVLMWEGSTQALRDPQGEVLYSQGSALYDRYNFIADAAVGFGFALLGLAGNVAWSPWFARRRRLSTALSILLCDAGISFFIAGAFIQDAKSAALGELVGDIVFSAIGIAALVTAIFKRAFLRRKHKRDFATAA